MIPTQPRCILLLTYSTDYKEQVIPTRAADAFTDVCLAGRIMSVRDMGKASFAELQDSQGRIQIHVRKDDLAKDGDTTMYDQVWKKLMDIGDFIGVKGFVFTYQNGRDIYTCKRVDLAGQISAPAAYCKRKRGQVFDAVTDPEFKYRQRYADLVINPM